MNLRQLLDEGEMEILFTALEAYEKKCLGLANKSIMGYGKTSELVKKEEWKKKAVAIREVATKIAETAN